MAVSYVSLLLKLSTNWRRLVFFIESFLSFDVTHVQKLLGLPPPILLSHFPLYRRSDALCSEPDEAPPEEKEALFRERFEIHFSTSRTAIWVIFSKKIWTLLTQVGMYQQWEQPASPSSDPAQISFVRFSQKHGWLLSNLLSMTPNLSGHTHHGCNTSHGKGQTALP